MDVIFIYPSEKTNRGRRMMLFSMDLYQEDGAHGIPRP